MSVKIMSEVFERSKTQGNARLVLLSLADSCNDDASCWPSIRKLSEKANISEPITKKYLNALIEIGVVTRDEREDAFGRQTSNLYTINVEKIGDDEITRDVIHQVSPPSRVKSVVGITGVSVVGGNPAYSAEGVTSVSLSIMNRHKEPSLEPSSDNSAMASQSELTELIQDPISREPQQPASGKCATRSTPKVPRKAKLADDAFLAELAKNNPGIDVLSETRKMKNWLLANPSRQFTRAFAVNWINRAKETNPTLPNGEVDWHNWKPNQ